MSPLEEYELYFTAGKPWFDYWMENPEQENRIFNELQTPVALMSHIYFQLLRLKKIKPLNELEPEVKKELKKDVFRIDPTCDKYRGMKIAQTIYVFGYLSNF